MSTSAEPAVATVPPTESATRAVRELLSRHGRERQPCAVAYLDYADPGSCIGVWEAAGTLTPLVGFLPLPLPGSALLDAVTRLDASGTRLVTHYRRAFPDDAGRFAAFGAGLPIGDSAAPAWLLAAVSLALGLDDADVAAALNAAAPSVAIDTFVVESAGSYLLDGRRLVRSLMSYRIAGVAPSVLARSVFDSVGRFVAEAIVRLVRDWHADAIVCAGDLFAGNIILRTRARHELARLRLPVIDPTTVAADPGPSAR